MTSKLNDAALNQLFIDGRTVHGFLPDEITDTQIHGIYDLI